MKRVKRRAAAAALIALLLIGGITAYVVRFALHGGEWVLFPANGSIYENGVLTVGTLTDRNGTVLAYSKDGERLYSDDAALRTACLHAVGDFQGNIGTGAVTAFADRLVGYSPLTGTAGNTVLALTIDSSLCTAAYDALAGRKGAVLVMDYTTGEILCMVSTPSYDPLAGFDEADSAYEGAYINRCISSVYAPGSVFKLVTLAAAVENMDDLYERTFTCIGSRDINGIAVNCTGVHGAQTIEQALANSCNCAFAEISLELGSEALAKTAEKLGLCEDLRINGVPTRAGSFDKAASGSADLAWSGIGQYTDLVCPYAMLRVCAAIANGGTVREGTLIRGEKGASTALLSEKTAQALSDMMSYDVVYSYGSGNFPGLALCAKSGTAELGDGRSNSWFAGFLNDAAHPYAFCVMIEGGGSGLRNAGAVANSVLQKAVGNN